MSRYERTLGTDWERLDTDEATTRAYAIGVAERLGERNREELERVYETAASTYERSMVELAYREGRREAKATAAAGSVDSLDDVWGELVEGGVDIDPGEPPTGGREGLPEALDAADMLDRRALDSTDVLDRPEFLDR